MNRLVISDFNGTGRAGRIIGIGKGNKPGASRTIDPGRKTRDRNYDIKGKGNINRGLRFGNISNKGNLRFESPGSSNKDHPRFENRKDKGKNLRFSSQDNTLSLKENLKQGRENTESGMATANRTLTS